MVYNGYTIKLNGELIYDATQLSKWDLFWQSDFGKWLGKEYFLRQQWRQYFCRDSESYI